MGGEQRNSIYIYTFKEIVVARVVSIRESWREGQTLLVTKKVARTCLNAVDFVK